MITNLVRCTSSKPDSLYCGGSLGGCYGGGCFVGRSRHVVLFVTPQLIILIMPDKSLVCRLQKKVWFQLQQSKG
jgi:hypothetical protein